MKHGPTTLGRSVSVRPERFLNGSHAEKVNYLGKHFQYLPFGSGRRICPGIPLVERMSVLVLASLLHAFQWKLPSDTVEVDLSERFGMLLRKLKPLITLSRVPDSSTWRGFISIRKKT
ncbi:hypothetical protein RDABS01_027110 [Bienertia sinuspersici]